MTREGELQRFSSQMLETYSSIPIFLPSHLRIERISQWPLSMPILRFLIGDKSFSSSHLHLLRTYTLHHTVHNARLKSRQ